MTKQIINQTLPQEYKPYQIINFCGNTFKSLKYLIDDYGFIPFMIGIGDIPRLWLYAKKDNNSIVVVRDSVAIIPVVKVNIFNREKRIEVELTQIPELKDTKIFDLNFAGEIPIVNQIDLRPIGYNVYGDKTSLTIGEQNFKGTLFENMQALIKIDK